MHDLKLFVLLWDSEYMFVHAVPHIASYAVEFILQLPQERFISEETGSFVSNIQLTEELHVNVLMLAYVWYRWALSFLYTVLSSSTFLVP